MASIRDVAAPAGNFAATVSRYPAHRPAVRPATRPRVREWARAREHRPRVVLRPSRAASPRVLAPVVGASWNPHSAGPARAVVDAARAPDRGAAGAPDRGAVSAPDRGAVNGKADGPAAPRDRPVRGRLDDRVDDG